MCVGGVMAALDTDDAAQHGGMFYTPSRVRDTGFEASPRLGHASLSRAQKFFGSAGLLIVSICVLC